MKEIRIGQKSERINEKTSRVQVIKLHEKVCNENERRRIRIRKNDAHIKMSLVEGRSLYKMCVENLCHGYQ